MRVWRGVVCHLVMCDLQRFLFTVHKLLIITFCCCSFSKYFIHIVQVNNVFGFTLIWSRYVHKTVCGCGGREKPDTRT